MYSVLAKCVRDGDPITGPMLLYIESGICPAEKQQFAILGHLI
jgi:hypothetical protein